MRCVHRFRIAAPVEEVVAFHRRSSSLPAVTPPFVPLTRIDAPETLAAGDRMAFTLWMGPVPVRWEALIEESDSRGFVDVQTAGPFRLWRHRHRFVPDGVAATFVDDHVTAELARHPVLGPVGWSMFVGLPALFAYRARAARRVLEGPSGQSPSDSEGEADR